MSETRDATDRSDLPELSATEDPEELEGSNAAADPPEGEETRDLPEPADEEPETRGMPARLSKQGAEFIARFEGCVLKMYNDPTNNATIGIGHLIHMGPINGREPAEFRQPITRQRAIELLMQDANKAASAVHRLVRRPLNQPQVDALISFVFNVGEGNFASSTLRRKLNAGDVGSVPHELSRWTLSQGNRLPGLVRRRAAEGRLFSQGSYG